MENTCYDVVIIGSGLGGLISGVVLAAEGLSVCIIEKNKQVGGSLQTFVRDKCILDTGVHYIGGLGEGQSLNRYFSHAGIMKDLKIKALDEAGFDVISFEGDALQYPQAQGYKLFAEQLTALFPHEKEGIRAYCKLMQDYCKLFPLYSLDSQAAYPDNFDHLQVNARDAIAGLVRDPKLQAVLAGNNMIYAGDANSPFYIHALATNAYIQSAWRCVDGGGQISKLLLRELRRHGGEMRKHCQALRFHFNNSLIESVEIAGGERIFGKRFISNIHPISTLKMVDEGQVRKAYRSRINGLEEGISSFSVYLTLQPEKVPYIGHNFYHLRQPDAWNTVHYTSENWLQQYLISMGTPSKTPDFTDSIALMAYMRSEEVAPWADSQNTVENPQPRGEAYEAFKQAKAELCVAEILKKIPQAAGHIKGVYTSTPLSFRDYIGSPTGSLYGTYRDSRDPMRTMISSKTKIENLWLTGQNTNLHGILGVTVSAYLTCFEILGKEYLLEKVLKA